MSNSNIKETSPIQVYWANLCILNKMEGQKMEAAGDEWSAKKADCSVPEMIYLGDTAEVGMYEYLQNDLKKGTVNFDLIVSSRFDIFCSKKYLLGIKDQLLPIAENFSLRPETKELGVADPEGLFHPLVLLPHFIVANTKLLKQDEIPKGLSELLQPEWDGKVFLGATDLPSAKAVLFSVWHLFGSEGLEKAVKNWRQKSAPSAARHGLVKDQFPIALLPGVFGGPGPDDKLQQITPEEGAPVLPSFAAVKRSDNSDNAVDFLKASAAAPEFIEFYRTQAHAYPAATGTELPENSSGEMKMIFPPWEWILKQDMDYFEDACKRMPMG